MEEALEWTTRHDVAVALRFARVLPRDVIAVAAAHHVTFELQLFHSEPARAQVLARGMTLSSLGSLLVQAQHLLALHADVLVRISVLMPVVHGTEQGEALARLLAHVAAARLHHVEVKIGRLDASLANGLRAQLAEDDYERLLAAYGQPHHRDMNVLAPGEELILPQLERSAFLQEVRALAGRLGLRLAGVGHRARERAEQASPWAVSQQPLSFARGA